jgi:epoxyqueuosine reductase
MRSSQTIKDYIIQSAKEEGFVDLRFAKAKFLEKEAKRLESWLRKGFQGQMKYLNNHFEKRTNPENLVPGTKTIAVFAHNYYPESNLLSSGKYKIARYAYGKDYHKVIKKKLKRIYQSLKTFDSSIEGRYFVDSAPILERDWARRSGLAWTGKNTLSIHPKRGSYFFLAIMMLNVEIPEDTPIDDHCGTCRRCIEACPTQAIAEEGYEMDGSKCISYLTIELKDESIPTSFKKNMDQWIFGCDICQEVCPWNKFSIRHNEHQFIPKSSLLNMNDQDWIELNEEKFNQLFEGSAVKRTKFMGLKRNIKFITE